MSARALLLLLFCGLPILAACGGAADDTGVVPCSGEREKFCGPGSDEQSSPPATAETPPTPQRPAAPTRSSNHGAELASPALAEGPALGALRVPPR